MALFLRSAAVWLALTVLAILNGSLRESVLIPTLGQATAFLISGIVLSVLVLLLAQLTIRWLRPHSTAQAWGIGLFWLVLTLAFEFGFGALVQHRSLAQMLQAYTFEGGNIWPVVLAVTLIAPALAYRVRLRAGPAARQ